MVGRVAALLSGLLASSSVALADDAQVGPWEPVGTTDGVTVLRRSVDGTPLKDFVGRAVIAAPLARVLAVMDDDEHRPEWSEKCRESRILAVEDERTVLLYDRTAAPWPVDDRDVVLRVLTVVDTARGEVRIDFQSVEDARMPAVKGVVRMPFLRGHYLLAARDGGASTFVEYQVHANPGGALPDWVRNLVSKALPRRTLQGLQSQVKKPRYAEMAKKIAARPEYQTLLEHAAPRRN